LYFIEFIEVLSHHTKKHQSSPQQQRMSQIQVLGQTTLGKLRQTDFQIKSIKADEGNAFILSEDNQLYYIGSN
jgi:hypothetical protein